MKNATLLIGLFLLYGSLYGQDNINTKNSARFGINRAFFGAGDVIGPGIYGEYSYSLNDYFALTPRIMIAYGNRKGDGHYSHASSFGTSLSIRITPLPRLLSRLKFDFGGLYHRFIDTYGNIGQKDQYGQYFSTYTYYYVENLFGLIGSLNINVIESKKAEIGLRFDTLTSFTEGYFNCDSWQTGVYVGLKF
ncbi:MAG: hypothetical protein MUO72_05885 [Bacteroidales bacterium]|nr:hypothetical protein [Bacteroidales bacterium]